MTGLHLLDARVSARLSDMVADQAEFLVNDIVQALGELDSTTQAAFLGAFARALKEACRDVTRLDLVRAAKQVAYLADDLDDDAIWLVEELFAQLKVKGGDDGP